MPGLSKSNLFTLAATFVALFVGCFGQAEASSFSAYVSLGSLVQSSGLIYGAPAEASLDDLGVQAFADPTILYVFASAPLPDGNSATASAQAILGINVVSSNNPLLSVSQINALILASGVVGYSVTASDSITATATDGSTYWSMGLSAVSLTGATLATNSASGSTANGSTSVSPSVSVSFALPTTVSQFEASLSILVSANCAAPDPPGGVPPCPSDYSATIHDPLTITNIEAINANGDVVPGFDFYTDTGQQLSQTPLPAALPLFATGLGALGLLGWRRKRKSQAVAA